MPTVFDDATGRTGRKLSLKVILKTARRMDYFLFGTRVHQSGAAGGCLIQAEMKLAKYSELRFEGETKRISKERKMQKKSSCLS